MTYLLSVSEAEKNKIEEILENWSSPDYTSTQSEKLLATRLLPHITMLNGVSRVVPEAEEVEEVVATIPEVWVRPETGTLDIDIPSTPLHIGSVETVMSGGAGEQDTSRHSYPTGESDHGDNGEVPPDADRNHDTPLGAI